MDLVKRMKDMTRATLNEMLENSEDPVRAIDRYINEQRQNIRELELLYRDQLKHAHSLRKQIDDAAKIAEKREQQAELAMRAGEEHVARMALEDKIAQEEKRERYKQLYAQAKETLIELEERLGDLQNDLREVVDKRQYYSARMEIDPPSQKNKRTQNEMEYALHELVRPSGRHVDRFGTGVGRSGSYRIRRRETLREVLVDTPICRCGRP